MAQVKIEQMINNFNALTEKPVKYLTVQNDIKDDIKNLVKSLYDYTKAQEKRVKSKTNQALQEIIVSDFDDEQIWQQLELQNTQRWDQLVWDVTNCVSNKNDLMFPIEFPQESMDTEDSENDRNNDSDINNDPSVPSDDNEIVLSEVPVNKPKSKRNDKVKRKSKHTSIVDDQFFKLNEMEEFLLNEEKMDGKKKKMDDDSMDESIDMFDDIDSEGTEDEGGKEGKYSDFFDEGNVNDDGIESENNTDTEERETETKKGDKKVRFANVTDDSESEEETVTKDKPLNGDVNKEDKKTEFELRQQRLKNHISKLEEKTLTEAPWQLKGEINASKRPQNSLLEEVLDFDLTTRPPPIITEQTTVTLEGLIRQRIKDKAWGDVVKKEKPVDDQLLFKKPEVLDQSKSKLSLAQVYEAEYLKQKQALSGEVDDEKEPESHTEIRDAMTKLFSKLDALCHYHYTPKAPQAEVKIVSNTPAISMEEVAPVATSDAALLAPEEVKRKRRGDLMAKEERTQTDKNRERRKKKKLQRKKGQVMKVTEHRNTTKGVEANDKSLKTSKAFFQQLNDNAKSLIKSKSKKNVKNKV